jgi:hypothetical protein
MANKLHRIKMALKGVDNPTRFFTGSPIVAVCPKVFATYDEAREYLPEWEDQMLNNMPPGTETQGAEIFTDDLSLLNPISRPA